MAVLGVCGGTFEPATLPMNHDYTIHEGVKRKDDDDDIPEPNHGNRLPP